MPTQQEAKFKKPQSLSSEEREKLIHRIKNLLQQREDILFAYLFGPFAEGGPFRDIDLALGGREPFTLGALFELNELLEKELFSRRIVPFSREVELRTDLIERCSRLYPEYVFFCRLFLHIGI
uniref:Polymerase beta nucleotidyltransferase domain-containing protein n=1 Tax=Caldimicrobium thiodismutans TaxID=1653476 RepID=A0A832GR29_9BACT